MKVPRIADDMIQIEEYETFSDQELNDAFERARAEARHRLSSVDIMATDDYFYFINNHGKKGDHKALLEMIEESGDILDVEETEFELPSTSNDFNVEADPLSSDMFDNIEMLKPSSQPSDHFTSNSMKCGSSIQEVNPISNNFCAATDNHFTFEELNTGSDFESINEYDEVREDPLAVTNQSSSHDDETLNLSLEKNDALLGSFEAPLEAENSIIDQAGHDTNQESEYEIAVRRCGSFVQELTIDKSKGPSIEYLTQNFVFLTPAPPTA